ncbi:2,3-bisphosphoglycerate-independent phosphoglycerate mutase [Elysia marginata]|uniref:phosphoglycerate mutase (2,3-diphosphoglycerate-independent) n=1 Tax=Elysia marginata TaxID=1093978 RepID=A0AAV4F1S1_9GAST|nr:2,3-bisphosphoglycerate-independent phosphoglycerate mutase [Elysia marginata]
MLLILDGWGISPNPTVSAIDNANTPFMDSLYKAYPHATLKTFGMDVGLPDGQMGNSEVGHMNIGAGRIVYQDLVKINLAVKEKRLAHQKTLKEGLQYAKDNNSKVHFLGLLSNGGVHSHIDHLKGLICATEDFDIKQVYIHAFTDGRDVDPKSGKSFIKEILEYIDNKSVKLASVIGRYYAMDRDKRWDRVKQAYDLLVNGQGDKVQDVLDAVEKSYKSGTTDEFIKPIVVSNEKGQATASIENGDVVIFFNFRTDRGRQLTEVLSQKAHPDMGMSPLDLHYITMTCYDESFKNIGVIYNKENIKDTLGEVLAKNGKKQIRIAETEKYPHITFFFNGGKEMPFENEKRILCPSPKVATYDLKPEMSAYDIRDKIVPELTKSETDFICLNFANPDMVGHTGSMQATIKAVETVDKCTKDVIETALKGNYTCIIIADHGNCDTMSNPNGSPNTSHTTNLVPIIVVDKDVKRVQEGGILADIAPTILKLMGIAKPKSMTQKSLV